jgi:hypothetical protein
MSPLTDPPFERRSTRRYEALGRVEVTMLTAPMSARVREISQGGFALETSEPAPVGVQRFRFEFEDLATIEFDAEAVHSARISLPGEPDTYLAGFELLPCNGDTSKAIAVLVDRIGVLALA